MPKGAMKMTIDTDRTPVWVSIREAAEYRAVSTDTIRAMIARGEVVAERFGPKLVRIRFDSLTGTPIAATA